MIDHLPPPIIIIVIIIKALTPRSVARVPQVLSSSSTHPGEGCQGRQVASINTGPQRNEDRVDVRPEETS